MTNAVTVRGLHKRYKDVAAVDGVDLDIEYGEILALIGPNGAGKTTTVEILEGHRTRDGGEVRVLGVDPARAPLAWRRDIGIAAGADAAHRSVEDYCERSRIPEE